MKPDLHFGWISIYVKMKWSQAIKTLEVLVYGFSLHYIILLGLLCLWNDQMISVICNKYHEHHLVSCFNTGGSFIRHMMNSINICVTITFRPRTHRGTIHCLSIARRCLLVISDLQQKTERCLKAAVWQDVQQNKIKKQNQVFICYCNRGDKSGRRR